MEQHKVKARRRTRPEAPAHVDERFKVVVDDGEPSSRTQFVVGTSPLSFDSVPPYLGQVQPSNELDSAPRSSMIKPASAMIAADVAAPAGMSPMAMAPAAPASLEAPHARRRGWLLLAPAMLLGLGALMLAFKLVITPSASANAALATPPAQAGVEAASEAPPIREAAAAPAEKPADLAPAPAAVAAEEDDIEILAPEAPSHTQAANTQGAQRASRPRPATPTPRPAKPEPTSPVIF